NRTAVSRKRRRPGPSEAAAEKYHEGQLVEGTVTNVVDVGAFVALEDGLEGLLHLSEMGDGSLKEPHSYVKKGDKLSLRISHLEPEKRRVGFTQRWGTDAAPEGEAVAEESGSEDETEAPVDVEATTVEEQAAPEEVPVDETPAELEDMTMLESP